MKKGVENSEEGLDSLASNESSKESKLPGSPYLNRPLRSLTQAVAELGLDQHADLLNGRIPNRDTAVLVRLPAPSSVVSNAIGTTARIGPSTYSEEEAPRKVANLS